MRQIIMDFGTLELFGFELPLRMFSYGLMLVLGFLTAVTIARWRAKRSGENPDVMTQVGLIALISGIVGARAAYVIQHWKTQFTGPDKGIFSFINITSGGLTYYGGLILGMVAVLVFLRVKRVPLRRHLDIVAASLMIGLAFGRMGCLLNGCCYGSSCGEGWTLGMTFPMYSQPLIKADGRDNPFSLGTDAPSPVYQHQLSTGAVVPDEHLFNHRLRILLAPRELHSQLQGDQLAWMDLDSKAIRKHFNELAGADGLVSAAEWRAGLSAGGELLGGSEQWSEANMGNQFADDYLSFDEMRDYMAWRRGWLQERFDVNGDERLTGAERQAANAFLQADQLKIAAAAHSVPVKPAQLLGIINALLLAGILTFFHRIRRREGQVFALLVVLYPITRFVLEAIRDDNPHNLLKGILTHNQYTSLAMALGGVALFVVLHFLPPSAGPTWGRRLAVRLNSQ